MIVYQCKKFGEYFIEVCNDNKRRYGYSISPVLFCESVVNNDQIGIIYEEISPAQEKELTKTISSCYSYYENKANNDVYEAAFILYRMRNFMLLYEKDKVDKNLALIVNELVAGKATIGKQENKNGYWLDKFSDGIQKAKLDPNLDFDRSWLED